jgi:hypothetical protein
MRSLRYWLPIVAAVALLLLSRTVASPLLAYGMMVAATGLFFEVGTALLAGASRTGSMHDHRQ